MTPKITTLTLNPTIDLACEAPEVRPVRKIRTSGDRADPGGGGVNVARVVQELGGEVEAVILAGGVTGHFLEELLDEIRLPRRSVPIAGRTRISHTVLDRSRGEEFRFVAEGPEVSESEWRAALAALETLPEGSWLVASGSLPRGVPEDFYAHVAAIAQARGLHWVLDSSGPALAAGAGRGVSADERSVFASVAAWDRIAQTTAMLYGMYVVLCNRTGVEGGLTFAGNSIVVAPDGEIIERAPALEEAAFTVTLERSRLARARQPYAHIRDDEPGFVADQLSRYRA